MPEDPYNLDDNKVKLVAYSIVSVRRGHERVMPGGEGTVIITSRMTPETFASYIIGRYLQTEVSDDKAEVVALLAHLLDRYLHEVGDSNARVLAESLRRYLLETLAGWQEPRWKKSSAEDEEGERYLRKKYRQIPDEDKKYLRVDYVVSNRWPREPRKFEEEQIAVLEEIGQAISCEGIGGAPSHGALRVLGRTPKGGAAGGFE
jgi:hypothetical protein